ncbi:MAG: efflux RND transporter periplasmic adaptor subunit, partial [Spongiibacteraceae bacterium]|nr:efflux RND transporter periplasmic adaptor subunit [Spongiibacteraceae bacterium]
KILITEKVITHFLNILYISEACKYFPRPAAVSRIIVIAVFSLLISACESGQATSAPYYPLVQGAPLQLQQGYTVTRKFAGHVEAKHKVDLAFELAGTVLNVQFDEGDKVSAGQVLMQLDTRLLEDEREQLLALKEEVMARQVLVELQIARQRQLQQKGLAAQQRRDELDAEAAVLAAQFNHQQSRLSAVAVRISKSVIKAPYDAYISARYFDAGAVVGSGKPVLQLLEKGSLEARVGVPAKFANTLARNSIETGVTDTDSSFMTISLPDQSKVSAQVLTVGRVIDPVTRTVLVRLALPENLLVVDGDLVFLGMDEEYQQGGFWVPLDALSGSVRGMWNLMVLGPTDKKGVYRLELRSVELLHRAGGKVFVQGGVTHGEQYLVNGLHRVVVGQSVRVQSKSLDVSLREGG